MRVYCTSEGILVWVWMQICPYRVSNEQTCDGTGVGRHLCGSGDRQKQRLRGEHGEARLARRTCVVGEVSRSEVTPSLQQGATLGRTELSRGSRGAGAPGGIS